MSEHCEEYRKWVEEAVEKPIDVWVEKQSKKCKKRKWYDPRRWLCWIVTTLVRGVRWILVWIGKWVTYVLCEAVSTVLNGAAGLIELAFSIPFVGRLLGMFWSAVADLFWRGVDLILEVSGLRITKKLRIVILDLTTAPPVGLALPAPPGYIGAIQRAKDIYRQEANVELIVSSEERVAGAPYGALHPRCDSGAIWDDLTTTGTYYAATTATRLFDWNFLRLIGFASPIVVFVVDDVRGKDGCSMGPFTDYVVIQSNGECLAHELCHACGLLGHVDDPLNLQHSDCGGAYLKILKPWQELVVRGSRHVSFV